MLHDSLADWFKPIDVKFPVFCKNPAAIYEDVIRRRRPVRVVMSDGRAFMILDTTLIYWLRMAAFCATEGGFPEEVAEELFKRHPIGSCSTGFREMLEDGDGVTTKELAAADALDHLSISLKRQAIESVFPIEDDRYTVGMLPLLFATDAAVFDKAIRFVDDCFRALRESGRDRPEPLQVTTLLPDGVTTH